MLAGFPNVNRIGSTGSILLIHYGGEREIHRLSVYPGCSWYTFAFVLVFLHVDYVWSHM